MLSLTALMYDLHLHSRRSDGELKPLELAQHLVNLGCRGFSITDNNFLSTELKSVWSLAASQDVWFISGIEISSYDSLIGETIHILGYGNNLDREQLNTALVPVRDGFNQRAHQAIDNLNRKYPGLDINLNRLMDRTGSVCISRHCLANELRRFRNDGKTIRELLPEIYFDGGGSWLPDTRQVIDLITRSRGLAILAHPGKLLDRHQQIFPDLILRLAESGLRGIEVLHSGHTLEQAQYLRDFAKKFGLLVSGGSDWYGPNFSSGKSLGCPLTRREFNELLTAAG
ncbi:MAG: PHP domain-containing protein [Patescibacteria group bacterium]